MVGEVEDEKKKKEETREKREKQEPLERVEYSGEGQLLSDQGGSQYGP